MKILDILKKELIGKSIEIIEYTHLPKIEYYDVKVKMHQSTTDKQFASGNPRFYKILKKSRDVGKTISSKKWMKITDVTGISDDEILVVLEGNTMSQIFPDTEIKNIREKKLKRILIN